MELTDNLFSCRGSSLWYCSLNHDVSDLFLLPRATLFSHTLTCIPCTNERSYMSGGPLFQAPCKSSSSRTLLLQRLYTFVPRNMIFSRLHVKYLCNSSIELKTENDVVRFSIGKQPEKNGSPRKGRKTMKRIKMSKKAKRNELRFFRLKAKKKMKSPNPEVRIRYKLEKVGTMLFLSLIFWNTWIVLFAIF